jgi:hypothetical protein
VEFCIPPPFLGIQKIEVVKKSWIWTWPKSSGSVTLSFYYLTGYKRATAIISRTAWIQKKMISLASIDLFKPRSTIYITKYNTLHTSRRQLLNRSFPRCHCHCADHLRGVNDTSEIISAASMILWRSSPRCPWYLGDHLCGVNDTLEIIFAVSMISRR